MAGSYHSRIEWAFLLWKEVSDRRIGGWCVEEQQKEMLAYRKKQ